jgi:glucose-1-phosphate thymidylyltransferase
VKSLEELAQGLGAKASIYRQLEPLGTGHAIMCAKESQASRNCLRNTLIRADFDLDPQADVIWVKQVDQPEAYGVVKLNDANEIVELVEKPQDFVN